MRAFKICAAIAVNLVAALAVHVARAMTTPGAKDGGRGARTTDVVVVTPLEPSEQSGGGRAVKELHEILTGNLETRLVCLPDVAAGMSATRKRLGEILLHGVPALRTSTHCLFAATEVSKHLPERGTVFIEFAEGALFLLFGGRLHNRTVLRDHEVLLRRFTVRGGIGGWMERARAASIYCLCRAVLANIYRKVDLIVVLTDEDRRFIESRFGGGVPQVVTIPAPFRSPTQLGCKAVARSNPSVVRHLLFLGNLYHQPNFEALLWFLSECAPHLDAGFTLHLCGLDGPLDVTTIDEGSLTIVRHGFLDDIESELEPIRIGVSPVISGGGTRMKNLYLGSTGRVVVTTRLGNEGIGFIDGHDAIIRDDGPSMATALNEIARDPDRARTLGERAAHKVRDAFCPEKVWSQYREQVFGDVPRVESIPSSAGSTA